MSESKLALIFHYNDRHSEVHNPNAFDLIDHGLGRIFDIQNQIPWNFHACTESIKILEQESPNTLKKIKGHPNVQVVGSLRTHALPSMFGKYWFEKNLKRGHDDLEAIFKKEQISPAVYIPERDVSLDIIDNLQKYWSQIIVGDDNCTNVYPYRENLVNPVYQSSEGTKVKGLNLMKLIGSSDKDMPALVINDGKRTPEGDVGGLRDTYLKLFRGYAKPKDFIQAAKKELRKAGEKGEPMITFFTDAEIPYVNKLGGKVQFDVLNDLVSELKKSKLPLVKLDHNIASEVSGYLNKQKEAYLISGRFKEKWLDDSRSEYYQAEINDVLNKKRDEKLDTFTENICLHSMVSDTFSALAMEPKGGVKLDRICNGFPAEEVHIRSDMNRLYEIRYALDSLKGVHKFNGDQVHKSLPYVKRYFDVLANIYKKESKQEQ